VSELKAAAERRRTNRRERYEENYYDDGDILILNWADRMLDETPLTPELLGGLGFDEGILYDECGDAAIEFCGDTMFVFGGEVSLSDPLTLGQLRMLCQSLGIKLAE
jgi:hypothetical protein